MTNTNHQHVANDSTWKSTVCKPVRRIEILYLFISLGCIAFIANVVDSSQRNYREVVPSTNDIEKVMSSLNGMEKLISSLLETQDALTSQIEEINVELSRRKLELAEQEIVKPTQTSSYRKTLPVTSKQREYPIAAINSQRKSAMNKLKGKSITSDTSMNRKTQVKQDTAEAATSCDGTSFRLDLELDEFPSETTVTLSSEETGELFANLTFSDEEDAFSSITYETCLDKGKYMLRILDSYGDGIVCFDSFDGLPCYDVFIDNELVIEGSPFQTVQEHTFDSNSLCLTESAVFYDVNYPLNEHFTHQISFSGSNETLQFILAPEQPENALSTRFYGCLSPGLYDVEFAKYNISETFEPCDGPCYILTVSDEVVIVGLPLITDIMKHTFFITIDNIGRQQLCRLNPLLAPINELTNFSFDDRVSRVLNVIQALSNVQDINTLGSVQNKATCYILYDDPLQIKAEDRLLAQRYVLAVYLFSTFRQAEMLPLDMCLNHDCECNDDGDIMSVNLGKFFAESLRQFYVHFSTLTIVVCKFH